VRAAEIGSDAYINQFEKAFVCWLRYFNRELQVRKLLSRSFDFDGDPVITKKEQYAYDMITKRFYDVYIATLLVKYSFNIDIVLQAMQAAKCYTPEKRLEIIETYNKELEEIGGEE